MCENSCLEWYTESGQRLVVQYASWTKSGADPYGRPKANQDRHIVKEDFGGEDIGFFAVYDGHGADGAKVAQHLAKNLSSRLSSSDEFMAQEYREMFERHMPLENKCLMSTSGINAQLSGSTATAALLDSSGLLTVANVGDSRCILGRMSGTEAMAIPLTRDHTPAVSSEAARIVAHKGRIQPYNFNGEHVGPPRIWTPTREIPGLAMTRAFGDKVGASIGIIADPEVTQIILQPQDRYLILCSDGIYEFMNNDFIMSIVHHQAQRGWTPSDVAKCLVAEANRQWMEEEDGVIDDCTVIVVFLEITPPSPLATQKSTRASQESQRADKSSHNKAGKSNTKTGGSTTAEQSVSKTLEQVARRASSMLTAKEFKQKCSLGPPKLAKEIS